MPHGKFRTLSSNIPATSDTASIAAPAPSLIPFTNPSIVNDPILYISLDGECMPKTPFIAFKTSFPIWINTLGIPLALSTIPFWNPSITYSPISRRSIFSNLSKNGFNAGAFLRMLNSFLSHPHPVRAPLEIAFIAFPNFSIALISIFSQSISFIFSRTDWTCGIDTKYS